jgi:hypothetical protein
MTAMTAMTAIMVLLGANAEAVEPIKVEAGVNPTEQYFKTVKDLDSSSEDEKRPRKKLSKYLEGPRGKEIQQCARRCTSTCIRGGQGAPGLGPMALRRETVVFKDSYRSGSYCLSECVEICALQLENKSK